MVGGDDYPRDMIGYGRTPPDPKWPGDARIAVQFVINYEEGGENCVLHGDQASETFLFTSRGLPVTVFGVAMAMERNPEAVAAMLDAKWEIASHGWRWIDYQFIDEDTERDHLKQAIAIHERLTGSRPVGWYTGRTSPNTRRLIVEEGRFLYDADSYADDLPYWDMTYGTPHLVVPYTLDANDMRFATPQGFNSGDQFFAYLRDAFDALYEEGANAPKMMSIGLHCRLSGRPGRIRALQHFLDHVQSHDKVWVCRRADIARHWHAHHKPESKSQ
jgi:peptidoglycan/xylan/chitin deacetylase (PgdA/CDA1 family)